MSQQEVYEDIKLSAWTNEFGDDPELHPQKQRHGLIARQNWENKDVDYKIAGLEW